MRVAYAKKAIFTICCLGLFKFYNLVTKWTSLLFWLPKQFSGTADIKIWTQDYKEKEIKKNKNPDNYNEKPVLGIAAPENFPFLLQFWSQEWIYVVPFSVLVTIIVITGNEPNCNASGSLSLSIFWGPSPTFFYSWVIRRHCCWPEKMKHSGGIKALRPQWLLSLVLGVLFSNLNCSWPICPKSNVAHSYVTPLA